MTRSSFESSTMRLRRPPQIDHRERPHEAHSAPVREPQWSLAVRRLNELRALYRLACEQFNGDAAAVRRMLYEPKTDGA
jgi:hypothetical protein